MSPSNLLAISVLPVLLLLTGCSANDTTTPSDPRVPPYQLFAAQIDAQTHGTAFDAIVALRPAWLRPRGQQSIARPGGGAVVVYMDGARVGGADFLRQVGAESVAAMQYLNSADATTRFGTDHAGGVILVTTRQR